MQVLSDILSDTFADGAALMLAVMVFLAVAVLAFGLMAAIRVRSAVKRRAAGIAEVAGGAPSQDQASLRHTSVKAVHQLLDYTTKHYGSTDDGNMKVLRRRLIQAGIFDARAVGYFVVGRVGLAIVLGIAAFLAVPMFTSLGPSMSWLMVILAGTLGYVGPALYIDRRVKSRRDEHRTGFPDFMDLLVVCADSGLSMEASLERVAREHLGDRLGLEEARSFATLIQQSAELGSSITDALRVYSDDMRHKRLSRAEEKAYSLPAKLSIPMMICIFPVLFVVILLPVIVRLYTQHY